MGWCSQSVAFRCPAHLLPFLRKAAGGIRGIPSPEALWARMLEELGGSEQGRTNLTQLLKQHPDVLPSWVLFGSSLRSEACLMADDSEVYLKTSATQHGFLPLGVTSLPPRPKRKPRTKKKRRRGSYYSDSDSDDEGWASLDDEDERHEHQQLQLLAQEQRQRWAWKGGAQQEQQLQAGMAAGRADAEAASEAANDGFLLMEPPLALTLLGQLEAGSMLALGQVCRALRCASFEQLRREEAALFCLLYPYLQTGNGGWPQRYEPLQLDGAAAGSAAGGPATRVPTAAERRLMRCLALLCGSAEQAAEQWRQWESGTKPATDVARICSANYRTDDDFSLFFKELERTVGGVECVRCGSIGYDPSLFIVGPSLLPQLIAQVEASGNGELQRLLPLVLAAAESKDALCLHYFHWLVG